MACECNCDCATEPRNVVNMTVDAQAVVDALLRLKRERGGGSLGLA